MVAVDTNIWVYFLTQQDKKKKVIAGELIASLSPEGLVISNQILKEIAKVLNVKIKISSKDTIEILALIKKLAIIIPEMPEDIILAVNLREKYNLQFFDSVIYAFCLNNNIPVLITEDVPINKMNYGNKELTLVNPFNK